MTLKPKSDYIDLESKFPKSTRKNQLKLCLQVRNSVWMYFWPKHFEKFSIYSSLNEKKVEWNESDFTA